MEELEDIGWEAQKQELAEEQEVSKRPKNMDRKSDSSLISSFHRVWLSALYLY